MGRKSKKEKKEKKLKSSKICCTKCGECKGVSKDRKAKLIAQFGSWEEVHDTYVCRKCRKEHNVRKDGRVKPEKRTRKKKLTNTYERDERGTLVLPEWMKEMRIRESLGFGPEHIAASSKPISEKKFNEAFSEAISSMKKAR